jgi:hypothetical protein
VADSDRLYHRVPDRMVGETLYPLNRLAQIDARAAAEESRKYDGRRHLMEIRLPILDCLWNDVLHLSPVHPTKIKDALIETGCLPNGPESRRFFVIDPETLAPGKGLFFRHSKDTLGKYDFLESDFSVFDGARYRELPDIPDEQRRYFVRTKAEGGRPLLWARTPHVFYQGEIEVKDLKVIRW